MIPGTVSVAIAANKPQVWTTSSHGLNQVLVIETICFPHVDAAIPPKQVNRWIPGTKDKNFIVKYNIKKSING
jgi:hypothetical protein